MANAATTRAGHAPCVGEEPQTHRGPRLPVRDCLPEETPKRGHHTTAALRRRAQGRTNLRQLRGEKENGGQRRARRRWRRRSAVIILPGRPRVGARQGDVARLSRSVNALDTTNRLRDDATSRVARGARRSGARTADGHLLAPRVGSTRRPITHTRDTLPTAARERTRTHPRHRVVPTRGHRRAVHVPSGRGSLRHLPARVLRPRRVDRRSSLRRLPVLRGTVRPRGKVGDRDIRVFLERVTRRVVPVLRRVRGDAGRRRVGVGAFSRRIRVLRCDGD